MITDETARFLLGHRTRGWSVDEIADLILWIETGDEQYRPKPPEDVENRNFQAVQEKNAQTAVKST